MKTCDRDKFIVNSQRDIIKVETSSCLNSKQYGNKKKKKKLQQLDIQSITLMQDLEKYAGKNTLNPFVCGSSFDKISFWFQLFLMENFQACRTLECS